MRCFSSALCYPRQRSRWSEKYCGCNGRGRLVFLPSLLCPKPQAPALRSCVIVALHLGNNAIGDKGIVALADGLRHARGLQKLHLNDNEASSQINSILKSALTAVSYVSSVEDRPRYCIDINFSVSAMGWNVDYIQRGLTHCSADPSPPSGATATR